MAGPSESTEYKTMRKCTENLIQLLKHSIKDLGDILFANEVIPESLYDEIRESRESTLAARSVVRFMTTLVQQKPSMYQTFLELLKKQGHWTDPIVEIMSKCYETEKAIITQDQETLNYSEQSSSDESFHSAASDLNDKPSQTAKLPYLDTSKLNEHEKENLERRLTTDTRDMILRFSDFRVAIRDSFESRIPLDKVKDTILSLDGFVEGIGAKLLDPRDAEKIESAESLPQVFITLRHYVSFFNFKIIEHLVHQYGSDNDKNKLKEYCVQLDAFCQRNVYEIPAKAYSTLRPEAKEIALKCTQHTLTLHDVQVLKDKVDEIFGLNCFTLQLRSIREGCVKLNFFISAAVADRIFPVSPPQHSALSDIGVKVLSCEKVAQEDSGMGKEATR